MIVLGIETATAVCSVGLAGDEGLIAESRLMRKHSHAEVLSDMVMSVCDSAKVSLKMLDGIAISNGPGSFTGLRIGLGYAKGLAFGMDLSLIAVSTLEVMVCPVPPVCSFACVLLAARRGEAYRGVFQWQTDRWALYRNHDVVTENDIFKELPGEKILFLGNGTDPFRNTIESDPRTIWMRSAFDVPNGYSVAALGRDKLLAGERADIDTVVPGYIKRFQGVA